MSPAQTERDAALVRDRLGAGAEIAVVLGSGLGSTIGRRFVHVRIPYEQLESLVFAPLPGHDGAALAGEWNGRRIVAFSGRAHLYQGFSATQVTAHIRLATALGVRAVVLTNAAGALDPGFAAGDLMLVSDHLNLTGQTPLDGSRFVDMSEAYSPRLRAIVRAHTTAEYRLREGVYAGLTGPSYETPAEARYLRLIGGDAVGMSTVLETIEARALGLEVLAFSVVTNAAGASETTHAEVTSVAAAASERLATLVERVLPEV